MYRTVCSLHVLSYCVLYMKCMCRLSTSLMHQEPIHIIVLHQWPMYSMWGNMTPFTFIIVYIQVCATFEQNAERWTVEV